MHHSVSHTLQVAWNEDIITHNRCIIISNTANAQIASKNAMHCIMLLGGLWIMCLSELHGVSYLLDIYFHHIKNACNCEGYYSWKWNFSIKKHYKFFNLVLGLAIFVKWHYLEHSGYYKQENEIYFNIMHEHRVGKL